MQAHTAAPQPETLLTDTNYNLQLTILKNYQIGLTQEINSCKQSDIFELRVKTGRLTELNASLIKYIDDIEKKRANTYFFGKGQSYSTHDLAYSLSLCNQMLETPEKEKIDNFLAFSPKIDGKKIALQIVNAIVGLALIATGLFLLYELLKCGYLTKFISILFRPTHNFSSDGYINFNHVEDFFKDAAISGGIGLFMLGVLGCIRMMTYGADCIKNSYQSIFPTYKQADKLELTEAAKNASPYLLKVKDSNLRRVNSTHA